MIVYKILNSINGKIYIGQTKKSVNHRISQHLKADSYIGKALRKYGLQSFIITIIDEAITKDILNEKEKYWIKYYECKVPNGYNLTSGGDGNDSPTSEETKRKLRIARAGKSGGMIGKHHSEESKQKMCKPCTEERKEKLRGRHHSKETIQKMKSVKRTEEFKENVSKFHTGRNHSAETKEKISKANLGKKSWNKGNRGLCSEETLSKMRKPRKKYQRKT